MRNTLKRLFMREDYKGTKDYIKIQTKYEIIRTALFFILSVSIFFIGFLSTRSNQNLLTIVAVLGCLPASKSMVNAIMFLKQKGCSEELIAEFEKTSLNLTYLYDMVFTSYSKTFVIVHMCIVGNNVYGFSLDKKFPIKEFEAHLEQILGIDNIKNIQINIFTDEKKYINRLSDFQDKDIDIELTNNITDVLKSVVL